MKPLRVATDFYCQICDVYTSSQLTLDTHFEGNRHQSAIQKLSEGKEIWPKYVEANYHCELCEVYTTSRRMLEIHMNGNKHKNVQKRCEEEQKLLDKLRSADRQYPFTGIIERDGSFYCEVCQCDCTSISNVKTHVFGQRHRSNIVPPPETNNRTTKLEIELADFNQPVVGLDFVLEYYNTKAPELPRFYHCTLCNLKFRESQIIDHILGLDHRLNVTKENRLEKYDELMTKLHSKGTTDVVEEWAAVLEHNYGRGRPTLKALRPNRKQENLDTLVIEDSDNEDKDRVEVTPPPSGSKRGDQSERKSLGRKLSLSEEGDRLNKTRSVYKLINFEPPSPPLTNFPPGDKRVEGYKEDTSNLPRNSQELLRNPDRPRAKPIKQEPQSPPSKSIHGDDDDIGEKPRTPRIKNKPRIPTDDDDVTTPLQVRAKRIKLEFPKLPDSFDTFNQTLCSNLMDQRKRPIGVIQRAVTNPEAPQDPEDPQPGPSSRPVFSTSSPIQAPQGNNQPPYSQQHPWPPQYTMNSQQYWHQFYYSWSMMTRYQYPSS